MSASPALQRELRIAARAFGRHGLAHAYGHCSVRLDERRFLVCAARPMGLIAPGEPGVVAPVDGPLPEGVLAEVRLHQDLPPATADAGRRPHHAACIDGARHSAPRASASPMAWARTSGPGPLLWDDPQLVRDDQRAAAVIDALGDRNAVVMRGNGVVVAADSLAEVLTLTWYLEDAARLELTVAADALCTMCIGVGQGIALIVERV